jgi:uncharacterized protein (TIGR03437 family)
MLNPRRRHVSWGRGACVVLVHITAIALWANSSFAGNLTLQISSQTVPAGGWAQIQISAAPPALIASGRIVMNFDPSVFGPIASVAVFSAAGDAVGAAVVNGQSLDVNFQSPSAGIGQLADLPVFTVTIPVLANAPTGNTSAITLDPTQSTWFDENHITYAVSVTPGSVTVGGSLSVQNLVPGGGLLAAGALVRINGTGFSTATTVSIGGVSLSKTEFVAPDEIDVTLGGAADLTGKNVVLGNPDGSRVDFVSSIPSAPDLVPTNFAMYQPLLSMQTWTSVNIDLIDEEGAIALQNPNPVPVDVVLQSLPPAGSISGQMTVTIPPGALNVYYTNTPGFISTSGINAFASLPLRMLGMKVQLSSLGPEPPIVPIAPFPTLPPLQQVTASPAAVAFNWQVGSAVPAPVSVRLTGSAFTFAVTWSGAPFFVTSIPTALSGTLTVAVNTVGLSPGSYNGSITITPEGPNAVVATIPLSLTVSGSALLNASVASVTFAGPGDSQGILSIASNGNPIPFTVVASSTPPNWLSVTPSSGTTPAQISVSANSAGFPGGVYNGQIVISGPNNTVTVPVQLTVNTTFVVFSPTAVAFSAVPGLSAPLTQTVLVFGQGVGEFSASTSSGGSWLSVSETSSGQLGAVVTANPASLAAGTYGGTVTLTSPTGSGSFPVTLTISNTPPTLTVTPASITYAIPVPEPGVAVPEQMVQVNSTGAPLNFTTNGLAGTFVTPASIPAPAQPGAGLGVYEYNVSVTAGAQSVIVPVTTIVTAGPATPPSLGSIVNAASQIPASVAPGEILTIYGFGAGPSNTAGFTLNSSGTVATSLNGAQVLFDGNPAPMIYGSAYQANVIVPYEVASQSTTTIALQYGGVSSAAWSVPVAASAPGIFTLGATGLGQAAVLNQDGSVNGASNPAARGSIIQIYATGEGQTSPPGVTGSVIGTDLKKPVLPVTAIVGGQNAVVQYAGSAGDSIAGLLQVNVVVPQGVTPGAVVPIVVSVGGILSQSGATIAVQ